MLKKITILLIITVLIVGVFVYTAKNKDENRITIGIQTSPAMALVMVAKDKGFFQDEGLDVELKEFSAGKDALAAFLGGSLDFSVSGDVPAALSAINGNKFIVPAQIVAKTKNEVRIVAKKEDNLNTAESFFKAKKRKIATSIGGGPEFFTYEFLNKLGIKENEIEIISQKPADMPAALLSGSVDAISIFDPFAFIAEEQLSNESITFTDENIYSQLYIVQASESNKQNLNVLEKLLKGLILAEKFTKNNPEEAKIIVLEYTKLDKKTIDGIWDSFDFRVVLSKKLIENWNKQVMWAKNTGKIKSETIIPNFYDIIFEQPLKKLSPSAIQL
jgi:ABC-type nitrate/sulfonate/bicarbonate transport system substrate-binding protein